MTPGPQPEVRRAANTAIDAIDTMLSELYQMRARLVGEIRASDDASAARAATALVGEARMVPVYVVIAVPPSLIASPQS